MGKGAALGGALGALAGGAYGAYQGDQQYQTALWDACISWDTRRLLTKASTPAAPSPPHRRGRRHGGSTVTRAWGVIPTCRATCTTFDLYLLLNRINFENWSFLE